MIKYRLVMSNAVAEFVTEEAAQIYKDTHSLPYQIDQFEEDAPNTTVIPDVTPRQFRQALFLSGIAISTIQAAIDAQEEPNKTLANIGLEYATAFERNNDIVNALGPAIGLDSEALDNLWLLAASL